VSVLRRQSRLIGGHRSPPIASGAARAQSCATYKKMPIFKARLR
jgi:hypothetical protein